MSTGEWSDTISAAKAAFNLSQISRPSSTSCLPGLACSPTRKKQIGFNLLKSTSSEQGHKGYWGRQVPGFPLPMWWYPSPKNLHSAKAILFLWWSAARQKTVRDGSCLRAVCRWQYQLSLINSSWFSGLHSCWSLASHLSTLIKFHVFKISSPGWDVGNKRE